MDSPQEHSICDHYILEILNLLYEPYIILCRALHYISLFHLSNIFNTFIYEENACIVTSISLQDMIWDNINHL